MDKEHFDLNHDGKITDEQIQTVNKMDLYYDLDKARDSQRRMAWFALLGMLLYPFIIILASFLGLTSAVTILGGMAGTYFVSVAAIVAAFYTKEAYINKINNS